MSSTTPLADKLSRLAQKLFELEPENEKADDEYSGIEDAVTELEAQINAFDEALQEVEDDEDEENEPEAEEDEE